MKKLCACGCGQTTKSITKGDPKRDIVAGSSRKYASHQCYLNYRRANKATTCPRGHTRVEGRCKICSQARIRAKKYNITLTQALSVPDNCECCGGEGPLQADHCHESGRFRGWLCRPCNTSLGWLKDNPKHIKSLYHYAKKNEIVA